MQPNIVPWMFKIMNTVGSNNLSLKYLRFTSGCKDLLKFEFVATAIIPFPKKCYYKYEH